MGLKLKQTQLHFYRSEVSPGIYKTKARLVRTNYSRKKARGTLHKIVRLSEKVTGDVVSISKALDSRKPTTIRGDVSLGAAKGVYNAVKLPTKAVLNTALAAESAKLYAQDFVRKQALQKASETYKSYAHDDTNKAAVGATSVTFAAVKGLNTHISEVRDFKVARTNAKHQRNRYRRIVKRSKARLNTHKADFNKSKDKYNYQKKKYKSSDKSKTQRLRLKLEKKDYKFAKKQYKSYKRGTKRLERKIHRSHTTLQRPVPIALKPIGYAGKSGFSVARNKAESADETNDVLRGGIKAYDVTKTVIRGTHSAARAVDSKYQDHLKKSISKGNEKLKLQHDRLSKGDVKRPESAYSKFRKRWKRANRNSNGSVKEVVKNFVKEAASIAGAAEADNIIYRFMV